MVDATSWWTCKSWKKPNKLRKKIVVHNLNGRKSSKYNSPPPVRSDFDLADCALWFDIGHASEGEQHLGNMDAIDGERTETMGDAQQDPVLKTQPTTVVYLGTNPTFLLRCYFRMAIPASYPSTHVPPARSMNSKQQKDENVKCGCEY